MSDIVNYSLKLKSDISESIKVCMPGTIESYDYKTQKANVKISIKELYNNGKEVDYPVVNNVPVVFLASGGASITLPVNKGDTCLLIFADRDMGNWLRGGIGLKPDSTRMHNLSDAIAIMGLQPFTKVIGGKNNEDLAINYAGSSINITKNGDINITTTKVVNVKSVENINIESKNVSIKATELLSADSKTATINISDALTLNSKSAVVTVAESTTVGSKNIIFNISETATTNCKDAVITASNEIKTTGKFTHTGELTITGDVKATGSITATGVVKSGAVTLATHTHSYSSPVVGSSPTAAIPATTGTPT